MEGMKTTLYDVLHSDANIKDAVYKSPGGVKVVPSGIFLYNVRKVELVKLKDILEELLLVVTPEFTSMPGALKKRSS